MFTGKKPLITDFSKALSIRGILLIALCLLLSLQTTEAVDGKHVNAYVVTPQWRTGSNNWSPATCDCGIGWAGNIDLVTVRNGAVTRVDTIWNRSQGYGQYPAFNADAKKIAFYRWAKAINGKTCTTLNNGVNYVAVMDLDGKNVKNLVALRDAPYGEMALNWPVGDWIYYINPKAGPSNEARQSNEIRKVNVNTLADQQVYSSGSSIWWRRFETTMDAQYAGFQSYGGGSSGDWNGASTFPNLNEFMHFNGCNAAISASGTYGSNYFAGNHTEICFDKVLGGGSMNLWLPLYDKTVDQANWNQLYPNRGSINDFLGKTQFNNANGAELMRWAANSDKWVLQMACYRGLSDDWGSNAVAANWVDKAAFMCSNNPLMPPDPAQVGTIYCGNAAGDMWVDGGTENLGKWEDTLGVWHAVPGFVPTGVARPELLSHDRRPAQIAGTRAAIQLMLPDGRAFAVRVIDMQGRNILRQRIVGCALIRDKQLCAGAYQVIAERGKEVYSSRITVAH